MRQKDYDGAIAGLYNLNGCLTGDYIVTISNRDYEKSTHVENFFQCNFCTMTIDEIVNKDQEDEFKKKIEVPTEIPYNKIEIFDMILSTIEGLVLGSKTVKAWICPNCKKENTKDNEWNIIIPKKEKPFYRKVVPEPPIRRHGLSTKLGYNDKFSDWFYNFLEEIQVSMRDYRIEYISQTGHDMEDTGFKDKGDEIGNN